MSSAPLSDDLGRRAGFPWYYPLVFLLNLAVILAVQLLAFYQTSLPLTEAALAEKDPVYENAVIRNHSGNSTVTWYLVETPDTQLHLVPVQRHMFLPDRGRIRTSQIVTIPSDTAYMEVQTKVGIGATTVTVGTEVEPWADEVQEHPIHLRTKWAKNAMNSSVKYTFTLFLFLALAMSIGEAVIWHKIKT